MTAWTNWRKNWSHLVRHESCRKT